MIGEFMVESFHTIVILFINRKNTLNVVLVLRGYNNKRCKIPDNLMYLVKFASQNYAQLNKDAFVWELFKQNLNRIFIANLCSSKRQ